MSRKEAQELGRMGEDWVRQRLERQSVTILDANWHCPWGEIDLIAANEQVIAFIEVKTRRSAAYHEAREAVDFRKRQNIILSAQQWLTEHPQEQRQPRFDVAEVYAPYGVETLRPKIIYIPNAFDTNEIE